MADSINPQELSDALAAFTEALKSTTSSVASTQVEFDEFGAELDLSQRQQRARDNAYHQAVTARIQKEKAAADAVVEKWAKISKASVSVASSMTSQEGAFNMLGNVTSMVVKGLGNIAGAIPIVGNALKGLGEGAADAVKLVTEQTGRAFATFGKISSTGVVTSFQDMRDAAERTGLLYEELDGVLSKSSQSLAMLGTTSTAGSKTLQGVLAMNKGAAIEAQKMGIAFAEYSEIQASYLSQQTIAGFARGKADKDLARGAKEYVYELDMLSKLTGKQRSAIQAEQEALQNNARFRAMLADVDEKQAKEFERFIRVLPKELGEGATDLLTNAGNPVTKAGQELAVQLSQGGLDVRQLFGDLRSGNKTAAASLSAFADASKKSVASTKGLTTILGTDSTITKNFIGLSDMAKRAGTSFELTTETIQEGQDTQRAAADGAAEAANKAHDLANQMQALLTSSKSVMAANNFVANSLIGLGKLINDLTGDNSSATSTVTGSATSSGAASSAPTVTTTGGGAAMVYPKAITRGIGVPSSSAASTSAASPKKILDLIGKVEGRGDYNIMVGGKSNPNLSNMTIAEVLSMQQGMRGSGHESTAVGKYQIIRGTLEGLVKNGHAKMTDKFDSATQDKLAMGLMKGRGYDKFASGKMSKEQFADNLAKEWASLPMANGRGAYDSVGSNKALVSRTAFLDALSGESGGLVSPSSPSVLTASNEVATPVSPVAIGNNTAIRKPSSSPAVDVVSSLISNLTGKYDSMIELLARNNNILNDIARNTS